MTSEQTRAEIARSLCRLFLTEKKAMSRHDLLVQFSNPQLLDEMENHCLCRALGNKKLYLPTLRSFVYAEDEAMKAEAKRASLLVVDLLRELFIANGVERLYETRQLVAELGESDHALDEATLRLGLYLCRDLNVIGSGGMNESQTSLESFSIAEGVVTIKDTEQMWNDLAEHKSPPLQQFVALAPDSDFPDDLGLEADAADEWQKSDVWQLLHPRIVEIAYPRFRAGLRADAVLAALTGVSEEIRKRTGLDLDGNGLMTKAFSVEAPMLVFGDVTTQTGRSAQQGFMQIFAGAMTGVRNPKAHELVVIDHKRCLHFLFLASLLFFKLDEAQSV